jgi:hypothetical protein
MALWVGARLDDEGCRVTVWGSREYLNRTATASVEVDSDDVREVRAALAKSTAPMPAVWPFARRRRRSTWR